MSENETAKGQHEIIGYGTAAEEPFVRTQAPGAQWFFEKSGQLGLFIHFGISAVDGNVDISWGMMDNPIDRAKGKGILTPNEYWALAKDFNPVSYHPADWLNAAKAAGFTYAVLTTRHHDGYALWPSAAGGFSTREFMGERDLVREYTDACRAAGLHVGLYYSIPDWRMNREYMSFMYGSGSPKYPERVPKDADHHEISGVPAMPETHRENYIAYLNVQLRELLTGYGKIDLLWFDGSTPDRRGLMSAAEMRALQPDIILNDRLWGVGDYNTKYECSLPETKPDFSCWEASMLWHRGGGWSYVKNADKYRTLEEIFPNYERVRRFGGQYLLNIAPDRDGIVPADYYTRVAELGDKVRAVYGE